MALVRINKFGGMIPRLSKRHLTQYMAQIARNCVLTSNSLRPLYSPEVVTPAFGVDISTIYLFDNQDWFQWPEVVDVARSQIAGNDANDPVPFERTYFTGADARPQVTDSSIATASAGRYPINSYDLGIPAPSNGPITSDPTPSDPDVLSTSRYVYTFVRSWNGVESEGPPSPPSNEVTVTPGDSVTITGLSNIADKPLTDANITHKRVYRVATADVDAEFQFVGQVSFAETEMEDTLEDTALGYVLPSVTWDPPPDDLHSIVNMPNGMMAGLSGNRLCFSEPWQPHAWPIDYRMGMAYTGVSLAVFGQSVIVTTDGLPYIATGVHPAAVSLDKIEIKQACVSKLSTVDMGEYIVYASPNGLVALGSGINNVLTKDYFTKREWEELNPSSMRAFHYDGQYICFYDNGTTQAGFVFDPNNPNAGYTEIDFYATAGFNDPVTDSLYLVIDGQIVKWDATDDAETYLWKSGVVTAPSHVNPGLVQVIAGGYPIEVTLYADNVEVSRQSIANGLAARLPAGYLAKDFEIELSGQYEVHEVLIGETAQDLKLA